MKVLFVCTGNTCRSPMAEHLFRKMLKDEGRDDIVVASAGTNAATWLPLPEEARKALEREGVSVIPHRARAIDKSAIESSDKIFAMEEGHRRFLLGLFPEAASKISLLDPAGIPDPYGRPQDIYDAAMAKIKKALDDLMPTFKRRT